MISKMKISILHLLLFTAVYPGSDQQERAHYQCSGKNKVVQTIPGLSLSKPSVPLKPDSKIASKACGINKAPDNNFDRSDLSVGMFCMLLKTKLDASVKRSENH